MKFWEGLVDYFFPTRCVACRKLLDKHEGMLCDECRPAYEESKTHLCPLCLKPLTECDCPNRYMERNNLHKLVKLYRYQAGEGDRAENRLIFRLKKTTDSRVVHFLADEMTPVIQRHLSAEKSYVIVGVPRSKSAIIENGGDHIALLCRTLAKRLKLPYVKAVKRVGKGRAQKTKTREERIASSRQCYAIGKKISLSGKTVILVDDVATTGASLVACAKVLRRMGAKTVICVVAGVSFRYRDMISDADYYSERKNKYGI